MKLDDLFAALDLPQSCRVDQRVPKKLLIENSSLSSKDRRQVNESIEGIQWLAALKPNSIGVAAYRDDIREYLEIAVLSVTLRDTGQKLARIENLMELIHRAIPYPTLLLFQWEQNVMFSMGQKRLAQNEAGKVIIDGSIVAVTWPGDSPPTPTEKAFMQALSLRKQPQATLFVLYEGWMDILFALLAARITGTFVVAGSSARAGIRRRALQDIRELESESARLRAKAMKATQLATQVELSLALGLVQAKMSSARGRL